MAVSRRNKRSNNSTSKAAAPVKEDANSTTDTSTPAMELKKPSIFSTLALSNALGMTPAQFSSLVTISIGMTHCLDLYRAVQNGEETMYCNNYFAYSPQKLDTEADPLACLNGDLGIMQIKYQTTIMRLVLFFCVMMMCWSNESLMKSWNYANAVSPLATSLVGFVYQRDYLSAPEKFSIGALLFLALSSNRKNRSEKFHIDLKEGLYNNILFFMTTGFSFLISDHLMVGFGNQINPDLEVSNGGKALWFMMVLVEYTAFMFAGTFALFYFDAVRKRVFLFCAAMLMLVNAFYQLPLQKDIWVDASYRQTVTMVLFFCFLLGALIPPFSKAVIKK